MLTNITFHLQLDERLEHSYYWLLLDNGLISNILLFKNINKKKKERSDYSVNYYYRVKIFYVENLF